MTDIETAIWVIGITIWVLTGGLILHLLLRRKRQETGHMQQPYSPGIPCQLLVTPVQREVLIRWIEEDPASGRELRSFAKQLVHSPPHGAVPVFLRQVEPLSDLAESHGMISLARQLRGWG